MIKTFKFSENLRRNIARFFLPILTVWFIVTPSQSYAIAPFVVAGVVAADSAAAAAATTLAAGAYDVTATAAVTLIGASLLFFDIGNGFGDKIRIPTTSDPAKQVPAPVAPSSAAPVPSFDYFVYNALGGGGIASKTPLGACQAVGGNVVTYVSGFPYCDGIPTAYFYPGSTGSAVYSRTVLAKPSTTFACPVGYSGNPCLLVDPRAASPDNNCDLARTSTSFTVIADPDCAVHSNIHSNPDGSVSFNGANSNKQPFSISFNPTASGGTNVNTTTQGSDAAGNSVNTNLNIQLNPQGVVTSATQTQTLPSGAPSPNPAVNPNTTPATTITPATDYARQGEAAAATVPVTNELQKLNSNFTTVSTTDPLVPLSTDVPTFGTTFNNLFGFRLPLHASACPTPTLTLTGLGMGVYTLDSHCNLLNSNSAPIRTSMIIVFLLSALFIVLRA